MVELIGPFRMRIIVILKTRDKFLENCAFGERYLSMIAVVRAYDLDLIHSQIARSAVACVRGRGMDEAIYGTSLVTTCMLSKERWSLLLHATANLSPNQYA
jgi:hypothetical protein